MVSYLAKLTGLIIAGLLTAFVIEPLDPSTVSTPFLLGIILMALSLRQGPTLLITVSVIYSILVVYVLETFIEGYSLHYHTTPHPNFWLFQRAGLFFLLCVLAIYLSYYRTNTQRILVHIQEILAKLPIPVVVSNALGEIVYMNDAISAILKLESSGYSGKRYIDCFMSEIDEGKAMRYYIELFQDHSPGLDEFEVKPAGSTQKVMARFKCLGSGSYRVLITVFEVLP